MLAGFSMALVMTVLAAIMILLPHPSGDEARAKTILRRDAQNGPPMTYLIQPSDDVVGARSLLSHDEQNGPLKTYRFEGRELLVSVNPGGITHRLEIKVEGIFDGASGRFYAASTREVPRGLYDRDREVFRVAGDDNWYLREDGEEWQSRTGTSPEERLALGLVPPSYSSKPTLVGQELLDGDMVYNIRVIYKSEDDLFKHHIYIGVNDGQFRKFYWEH
jgi:hypothetical protein